MAQRILIRNSWLIEQGDKENIEKEAEIYDVSESEMARRLLYIGWATWCELDQEGKTAILGGGTLKEAKEAGGE